MTSCISVYFSCVCVYIYRCIFGGGLARIIFLTAAVQEVSDWMNLDAAGVLQSNILPLDGNSKTLKFDQTTEILD